LWYRPEELERFSIGDEVHVWPNAASGGDTFNAVIGLHLFDSYYGHNYDDESSYSDDSSSDDECDDVRKCGRRAQLDGGGGKGGDDDLVNDDHYYNSYGKQSELGWLHWGPTISGTLHGHKILYFDGLCESCQADNYGRE
jgi:hypothetical protein